MDKLIPTLEQAVVSDWPACETADLDGWLLRASGGPTNRGNSVSTSCAGDLPIETRVAAAEAWYREREQPTIFQLGPGATPAGLDRMLQERGYHIGGAASALTAAAQHVLERATSPLQAEVSSEPTQAWLSVALHGSRFATNQQSLLGVIARLGARCHFVVGRDAGQPVAACLGVGSEEMLGVYVMLTLPAHRRRRAASALLRELARAGLERGQEQLYLLVERDNTSARSLYEGVGFEHRYDYHYRVRNT